MKQKLLEPNKALMKAAAAGDIEAVKKIVLSGADIYFRDHRGDTALWECCEMGRDGL
jgi:ankyrin repeat protein